MSQTEESPRDNPKAPFVKRVVALHRRRERRETGRFIVEGPQAVSELVANRPELLVSLYGTAQALADHLDLVDAVADRGIEAISVSPRVMATMSDTVHPQGLIAIVSDPTVPLAQAVAGAKLVAILHEVRDPGNAGAVLRAADAAGADAVVFTGDAVDPLNPKTVRATTGSLFHIPVATADLEETVSALKTNGLQIIAADVNGDDLNHSEKALGEPLAWLFGNEAHGLDATDRARADRTLRLPLFGRAESLNLATAAAVCLYTTAFARVARLAD